MANQDLKPRFYTQLEGLRGVAVFLVLISHFIVITFFAKLKFLNLGFWGVNIFFVLSGFLITEILLKEIYAGKSAGHILKNFYLKRTLRIFPVYYLTVIILSAFKIGNVQDILPWALTYTLNIGNIWFGVNNNITMHFWSLCVEEQFYLLWPLLLIVVPRRFHLRTFQGIILLAIILRAVARIIHFDSYLGFNHGSMFTCLDALVGGALQAYLKLNKEFFLKSVLKKTYLPVILVVAFLGLSYLLPEENILLQSFGRTICMLTAFFVVGWGALHIKTAWQPLVENRVVRYLGSISYGVYVFHWIIFSIFIISFREYWSHLNFGKFRLLSYHAWLPAFVLFTVVTIAVASLSYFIMEKPLLKLKRKIS